jgi:hypothetical protein
VRRALVVLLTVALALAGTVGLIAFLQSRDDSSIGGEGDAAAQGPGVPAAEEDDPRLAAGNVILTYRRAEDGATLRALAEDVGGPPDATLEAAGQAVIVLRRPNQSAGAVVAHALGRRLVVERADDPELRRFSEYWLGRTGSD